MCTLHIQGAAKNEPPKVNYIFSQQLFEILMRNFTHLLPVYACSA